MAGILGGLQSLHTDSYDEVFSVPTDDAARIAVATQNILREEAHLTDVIDPLGGSLLRRTAHRRDGGEDRTRSSPASTPPAACTRAVESGMVQRMIGDSALRFQQQIEPGEQTIVGVNAYQVDENPDDYRVPPYPEAAVIDAQIGRLKAFKGQRSQAAVAAALDALARAAESAPANDANVFGAVVDAASAGVTHGEICAALRRELGFGQPLTIV